MFISLFYHKKENKSMETTRKAEKNILIAFLLNLSFAVVGVCVNGCAAIFTHGGPGYHYHHHRH